MSTKKLYVLIAVDGPGAFYPLFTFNEDLIHKLKDAFDAGDLEYVGSELLDAHGFHYETLTVPVDCTAESLGITRRMLADDYADRFASE